MKRSGSPVIRHSCFTSAVLLSQVLMLEVHVQTYIQPWHRAIGFLGVRNIFVRFILPTLLENSPSFLLPPPPLPFPTQKVCQQSGNNPMSKNLSSRSTQAYWTFSHKISSNHFPSCQIYPISCLSCLLRCNVNVDSFIGICSYIFWQPHKIDVFFVFSCFVILYDFEPLKRQG